MFHFLSLFLFSRHVSLVSNVPYLLSQVAKTPSPQSKQTLVLAVISLSNRPSNFLSQFIGSQFLRLPYPDHDFSGYTIIVTGANVGLGLEAARHFVRLNAGLVILGCRDVERGAAAKADIESTTNSESVIEVWQVDLTSFDSVKEFCAHAQILPRLDIVLLNAGLATGKFAEVSGFESTITVNVISTLLMAFLLLGKLRETGLKFNTTPHITIVSSDAHQV
jgi:retinol dehydrogenase-12